MAYPYEKQPRQSITCDCGRVHNLQPFEETEWSIFVVYCDFDNQYAVLSKFQLQSGKTCPRCMSHRIQILQKLPNTKEIRARLPKKGLQLWQFTQGGLARVD
jgi:hypothetical protein